MGQHVVGADQVGLPPASAKRRAVATPKKATSVGNALRSLRHSRYWPPAPRPAPRYRAGGKIAADSRRCSPPRPPANRARAELSSHSRGIRLGVAQPDIGIRREVQVVGEDVLGRLERLELHQQTALADVDVQRVMRLHQPIWSADRNALDSGARPRSTKLRRQDGAAETACSGVMAVAGVIRSSGRAAHRSAPAPARPAPRRRCHSHRPGQRLAQPQPRRPAQPRAGA